MICDWFRAVFSIIIDLKFNYRVIECKECIRNLILSRVAERFSLTLSLIGRAK